MIEEQRKVKLTPAEKLEINEMAIVRCDSCSFMYTLDLQRLPPLKPTARASYEEDVESVLNVTLVCHRCGSEIIFRQRGEVIEYRHDPKMFGQLPYDASQLAIGLFGEATRCFINQTFRACASMCRATIEQVLVDQGYVEGNLETKIDKAKKDGLLDNEQVAVAHGSRLMGNRALHRASDIQPSPALATLGAAVSIVEHILDVKRKQAASPSAPDSNAP